MANIKVTPEELNSQGDSLVSYAGDLSDILKQIDAKIAEIDNGWDGLAQTAYTGMYSEMKTSLDQFPELVRSLGEATKSAAEGFSSVDEQLQSGFNSAM